MRRKTILAITGSLLISLLLCVGFVLVFINNMRYMGPCKIPEAIAIEDITGTWRIQYRYYASMDTDKFINGEEIITINPNGTYTQTFHSRTYNYESPTNEWKLIVDSGEGAKLVMSNLKYFAGGVEHSDDPFRLGPQLPDRIRYKKYQSNVGDAFVDYPDDGFVYLYPRRCIGKLSLLQMRTGGGDPDNLSVYNLPFIKIR